MLSNVVTTSLLFLFCFEAVALKSISPKGKDPCGYTEMFNASVGYDWGNYVKTVRGCLTDENITEVILWSEVYTFEAKTFVNMPKLRSLTLSNINVFNLKPGFVRNTPHLRIVNAAKNRIRTLEKGVFNELNLDKLDLSSNVIDEIHVGSFANFTAAKLLLKNNLLLEIFPSWFDNTRIEILDLSYNKIMSLYNGSFEGLVTPRVINLNYNQIHFVEARTFSAPMHLKYLYLAGNSLGNLAFLNDAYANTVDVGFNTFSNIDVEGITKIREILIYPNPWNCKCLLKFWKYAWDHDISYGESRMLRKKHLQEPVCISQGDCQRIYMDTTLQQRYFKMVNYVELGSYDEYLNK